MVSKDTFGRYRMPWRLAMEDGLGERIVVDSRYRVQAPIICVSIRCKE
jgi:hypothetical protein